MDTIKTVSRRIHPLVAAAAVSVIVLSGVGVAAITGVLPSSHGSTAPADNVQSSNTASMPPAGSIPPNANTPPPPPPSLAAGATPPVPPDAQPVPQPAAAVPCHTCGTVEAVRTVEHQAKPSGVGAVAGALIGGLIGNRFGAGNGRVLTTAGGAVGGGIAGNEIEKHAHTTTSYLVQVRMENGKLRSFSSAAMPNWHAGDQVKVVDGKLMARI